MANFLYELQLFKMNYGRFRGNNEQKCHECNQKSVLYVLAIPQSSFRGRDWVKSIFLESNVTG